MGEFFAREPPPLVLIGFDASLQHARVKDPGAPWQRLVITLGALLVVTKELARLLGEEWLSVQIVFLPDAEGLEPLAEERAALCA
jgi:hypothetical protein